LLADPECRLEQRRIRDQGEDAADVAGDRQKIRVARARMTGFRKPSLQQRPARRDQKERNAHRQQQHPQQPADGHAGRRRISMLSRERDRQGEK
jgi:hypothetical protein